MKTTNTKLLRELTNKLKRALIQLNNGDPCEAVDTLNRALALEMDAETRRQTNKAMDEADFGNPTTAETLLEMILQDLCPSQSYENKNQQAAS